MINALLGESYKVVLHYDVTSLVILAVITISMITRKAVKGLSNRLFFYVVIFDALACIADLISETRTINITIRIACDYLYFIYTTMIPALYVLYLYANIGLWHYFKSHLRVRIAISFPAMVALFILVLNLFTGWAFTVTPQGDYSRGPLQLGLIMCCLTYLIVGVVILFYWHKIIPRSRLIPLFIMIPCVLAGLVFQQIHIGFETTLFGLTIGILIISFTVQRTDENIDEIRGLKNGDCASEELRKAFATNQNFGLIFIRVMNQESFRKSRDVTMYNKFLKAIGKNLTDVVVRHQHVNCDVYYLHNSTYGIKVNTCNLRIARNIAQEIAQSLRKKVKIDDVSISVDSRICVASIPEDINNLKDLRTFQHNFYTKLPDSNEPVMLANYVNSIDFKIHNELDEIIFNALENHKFKMYYQPIYSIKEKRFNSAEALIRLNDEKYGFISPALFIPAAEANGAIHEIGDFVIDEVSRFTAECNLKRLGLDYLEYNLSAAQCIETNLTEKICTATQKYKLLPSQLNLEITETAADFDPIISERNIKALKAKGYAFSLDDYGTGYSNIKRLIELPFDIVKLDKSYVDEMKNPLMWAAIENHVRMFKEMDKKILVEGVEDLETFKAFEALGCDYIQGYYFSRPLPEEDFISFLLQAQNAKSAS